MHIGNAMIPQFEFSRPVSLETVLPHKPRHETLEATEEECAQLAKRFDLKTLSRFKATIGLSRMADGKLIKASGEIEADMTQACVVSLQDVPQEIKAQFETYFTEDGKEFDEDGGPEMDIEEDDFPVGGGGVVDVGELAAQYLSLEIDPYPRAPGVSLAAQMAEAGDKKKNRPFEILRALAPDAKKDDGSF